MNKKQIAKMMKLYPNEATIIELLIKLNVRMRTYRVNDDGVERYLITCGAETLEWFEKSTMNKDEIALLEELAVDGEVFDVRDPMVPWTVTIVNHNVKELEKIIQWKSVKKLSKTDVVTFGESDEDSILSISDLEDKIVYVHEREPSTNTLSLAKQFGLKKLHVDEFIFKGIEMYPSMLSHVKIDLYMYKSGQHNADMVSTYYTLDEVAYTHFLENMGTPKSFNMVVYRDKKKREYFDGFMQLKELAYTIGFEEREILNLLSSRTSQTKELMTRISDFTMQYSTNKNVIAAFRIVLNTINHSVGIDAISRDTKVNRNVLNKDIQEALLMIEVRCYSMLEVLEPKGDKPFGKELVKIMAKVHNCKIKDIEKMLKDYEVLHLVEELV